MDAPEPPRNFLFFFFISNSKLLKKIQLLMEDFQYFLCQLCKGILKNKGCVFDIDAPNQTALKIHVFMSQSWPYSEERKISCVLYSQRRKTICLSMFLWNMIKNASFYFVTLGPWNQSTVRHGIFPPIGGFPPIERPHGSFLRSVQIR